MVGGVAGRRCGGPRVMAVSMGVSDDECVHRTLPTTGRSARGDRGSRAEAWAGGKYVGIYRPLVDLLAATPGDELILSLAEIERIIGRPLTIPAATFPTHRTGGKNAHIRAWRRIGRVAR